MQPTAEWLKTWESKREFTLAPNDLEKYFTDKEIGGVEIDQVNMGEVSLPLVKFLLTIHLVSIFLWTKIHIS